MAAKGLGVKPSLLVLCDDHLLHDHEELLLRETLPLKSLDPLPLARQRLLRLAKYYNFHKFGGLYEHFNKAVKLDSNLLAAYLLVVVKNDQKRTSFVVHNPEPVDDFIGFRVFLTVDSKLLENDIHRLAE